MPGWLDAGRYYPACPCASPARPVSSVARDDLLRLMGYARGAYALGYVDDLRDPLDVLRGTHSNAVALGDLQATTERLRPGTR